MIDLLINTLESFGYPVYRQGSLTADDVYPATFFTFWNNAVDDGGHYDDAAVNYIWNFDVNVYSTEPELVNTLLLAAKTKLINNGFIIGGAGYDVASDEITHTGRGINALIIETL